MSELEHPDFKYMDFLPEAVLIQREGVIIYANEELLNLLHCEDCNKLLGKSFREIFCSHEQDNQIKNGLYSIKDCKENIIDIDIKCKTRLLNNSFYDFITVRDITIQKKQYDTLNEMIERDRIVLEKLPISMYITVDGLFEATNKEGLRLLGEDSINDIKGKSILLYAHPEELEFVNNRKHILYDKKETVQFEEQRIVKKGGEILTVESASFPFRYKDKNAVVTVIRDISSRKELERELLESKDLYKKLIDILPDGISIHDGNTYSFVNDAFAKIIDYDSSEEIVGRGVKQISDKKLKGLVSNSVEEIMSMDGERSRVEYKFDTRWGRTIEIECKSVKFHHNGKTNILSLIRDITENKKAEENRLLLEKAIEYDKLKTEFFSNMSHELRTPLNILLGSLQLINLYTKTDVEIRPSAIRKYINIMKQNCYRLLRLINNLLDITKIDSGFYKLNLHNYNIVEIVEDITQSVAEYMKEKNIDFIFDTDVEEKVIGCDADKIERVVLNLLSNAIKFTKPGGKIEVNIYDLEETIRISVGDNGIGIPEDKLNIIFDRFSQVDKSLSRRSEGTGIGLALVKSLVELHGGNISVKSQYGEYTEFIIDLPAAVLNEEDEIAVHGSAVNNGFDDKKVERMNIEFSDIYI